MKVKVNQHLQQTGKKEEMNFILDYLDVVRGFHMNGTVEGEQLYQFLDVLLKFYVPLFFKFVL